jgi:cytochrome c
MYKSYHKKLVAGALFVSTVLLGTACNASSTMDTKGFSKEVIAAVGPANAKVSDTVKKRYAHNGKLVVDGGVTYPIVHGKTGSYYVNEAAHKTAYHKGKRATANEIKAWDIDVMPDGTGLPEGEGSVEEGDELYEEKCQACHGDFGAGNGLYPKLTMGNAYELQKTLKNQRHARDDDGPKRCFGSYWPRASTLWWYIKTGMPHQAPMSLTTHQVYALAAYILSINEIKIDGEELDDDYVLNREKFLKIQMPNKDGFEPQIDGPKGEDNARAYFNNPLNYGNGVRCMKNCFEGAPKVQRIEHAISDFTPALSEARTLPKKAKSAAGNEAEKTYKSSCAVCHATDAMGAPAVGDKKAWAAVLKKGIDKVYTNGIKGINGMPPKGGTSLDDAKFKAVVDYMVSQSK